ncbi:MAG: hypothetical protein WCJ07_05760 [Verrucomicrobiota bacterium]
MSACPGKNNELCFGFLGGTSTNATLQIQNIQFYSFQKTQLNIVPMKACRCAASASVSWLAAHERQASAHAPDVRAIVPSKASQ